MKELKLTVKIMHSPCVEHIIGLILRLSSQETGGGVSLVTSTINVVQILVPETGGAYQITE